MRARVQLADGSWADRIPAWVRWATQEWNEIQFNGARLWWLWEAGRGAQPRHMLRSSAARGLGSGLQALVRCMHTAAGVCNDRAIQASLPSVFAQGKPYTAAR